MFFVSLLLVFVVAVALSWLPGYGLLRLLRVRCCQAMEDDEAAVAAWPLSWAILGGAQFLGFLAGLPAWWRYVLLATCVVLGSYGLAGARQALSAQTRTVLVLGLLGSAGTLGMALVTPVYDALPGWYGDWWMHYDIAQFYLGVRPHDVTYFGLYTIPSRFPLFNLLEAAFLNVFSDHFWVYQVTAVVPLVGLIAATYLTARAWLDERTALLASALLLVNPFVIQNALTPWPKVMAAACVLVALSFYLRRGVAGLPLWAVFMGLAVLAHQATVVIALAVGLHALLAYRRAAVFALLQAAAIGVLALLPWLVWAVMTYGLAAVAAAAPTVSAQGSGVGSADWLPARAWNAVGTLLPLTFLRQAVAWARSGFASEYAIGVYGAALRYSYDVLPGALTTVLSAVLLSGLWRYLRRAWVGLKPAPAPLREAGGRSPTAAVAWATGFVLLGGILLQPGVNRSGLAAESLLPAVVLLVCAAGRFLFALPPQWRVAAVGVLLLEFALTRGVHTVLVVAGVVGTGRDPNLALKVENRIQFIADGLTWEKGLALLAVLVIWLAIGWRLVRAATVE